MQESTIWKKESRYWLHLLTVAVDSEQTKAGLIQESTELMLIFGAIIQKSK